MLPIYHPSNMGPKRIAHVVTNVSHYENPEEPTGLWLSELTHAWEVFADKGYTQTLVSPLGGKAPLEPRSLKWPNIDSTGTAWQEDKAKMALLDSTTAAKDVNPSDFDAIYLTGGHAVMFDFPESEPLQTLITGIWAHGGVVSSVCHGYCGLLETKTSDGTRLIKGKKMTGFSWIEEGLAGVSKLVPYNAEQRAKDAGALYEKALIPFTSYVVVDGKLVTGQNPPSAKGTAEKVVEVLEGTSG